MSGEATMDVVRRLAELEPGEPVLSVYARTDPRDPANTAHNPAWLVELRNGLRKVGRRLEEAGPRDERLALRELAERVEGELAALAPADRARGVAWFVTPEASLDRRIALQLPPRRDAVEWDRRPFVSPLVDVADRGRPTGLVLVGGHAVRLLEWSGGRVHEPADSLYELELGDWRQYAAYAMANPARAQQTATNVAAYEQRVEEWRQRFLRDAAAATASRLRQLGWDRLVVASEGQVATQFAAELPAVLRERVCATVEANLLWQDAASIGERLETHIQEAWRRESVNVAGQAIEVARAGGSAALGWTEVVGALIEQRVSHLVLDPDAAPDGAALPGPLADAFGRPPTELLPERAVERAVATGAEVTALLPADAPVLESAAGIAAALRY